MVVLLSTTGYYTFYSGNHAVLTNYFTFNIEVSLFIIFQTRSGTILPWWCSFLTSSCCSNFATTCTKGCDCSRAGPTRAWTSKLNLGLFYYHLINSFTGVPGWNRQHHGQTIYPTEKFTSMNLFKIFWVVIWAWLFLISMEAVRCLTVTAHFGTLTQRSFHPTVPVLLTKRNKK